MTSRGHDFILSAFDEEQWCPVLQARFWVEDYERLREILGADASDDPELRQQYDLDGDALAAVVARFGVAFDPSALNRGSPRLCVFRPGRINQAPYVVHGGYELPLLLDGRKKLARLSDLYPPDAFEGEHRFDHWVSAGVLHKVEILEPFAKPTKHRVGRRIVYYTPKGEEWRIPAMQFLFKESGQCGGWNEQFERLEGALFGYTASENDWWIELGLQEGVFGGAPFCCGLTAEGLAWVESAGFRALPPSDQPKFRITGYSQEKRDELETLFFADPGVQVIVRFTVPGRHLLNVIDLRRAGPFDMASEHIPHLNCHLNSALVVVARRSP